MSTKTIFFAVTMMISCFSQAQTSIEKDSLHFFERIKKITKDRYYLYPNKHRPSRIVLFSEDRTDSCTIYPMFTASDSVSLLTSNISSYDSLDIATVSFDGGKLLKVHQFGWFYKECARKSMESCEFYFTLEQFNQFQWEIVKALNAKIKPSVAFKNAEKSLLRSFQKY